MNHGGMTACTVTDSTAVNHDGTEGRTSVREVEDTRAIVALDELLAFGISDANSTVREPKCPDDCRFPRSL